MIQIKTLYKNILYVAILALGMVSLHSCNEDKHFDFPGDSYNRVYMQDKSTGYKIVQTPISTISDMDFETTLKCTWKASEPISVTIEIDNSMIETFNKEHDTSYEAMPASALLVKNPILTIPTGAMASTDTLRLKLTDDQETIASLKSTKGYLIPLRIGTTEGGDSQASTNFYTTYLTVSVIEDNVNHDAKESDITGTLVADQSKWSAVTNGTVTSWNSPINAIFDGDKTTYFYINCEEDLYLDINMEQQYTFDALTFYYGRNSSWGNYEYNALTEGMTIYTSDDGQNWISAGEINSSSKFCVFYAPITAQYIRLVKPKGTSKVNLYAGLFNVYQK